MAALRVAQWSDTLDRACGFDSWGQVLEACNEYEKVTSDIKKALTSQDMPFNEGQAKFLNKTAVAASLRAKAAQDLSGAPTGITLPQMKQVVSLLKELPDSVPLFPLKEVSELKHLIPEPSKTSAAADVIHDDEDEDEEGPAELVKGGSLLPRRSFPGKTNITIRIDKIKLKDPSQYIEPFFTVSIKDTNGKDLAESQDTPPTNRRDDFIHFYTTVEMPMAYEDMPEDCAIFLEFKHYKPKKHKNSVKCFCILEKDELKNGSFPLEIYAKPTDFRRRKLHLLTEKPHYLFVTVSLSAEP
ncbi:hypothetical protein PTSG_10751 [Salpingoeca rosetta]|uniref:C2 Aida-type domain-containing protein n=1 Tax=Salpingoeca rosetta (strain ATCC 50818 / BSB-021) TaxID=946362 RepID=F2UQ98_SALR5|nr:uncharacterized protein PTSG_10751 [Salpingoeca rosetta]EGD79766.1 hypothetical protein PTSG_10751 [Salpingoeca rosetta]|eukprot:XP_004988715.1 hypothetical protein PTSG_10751 [Salpingoeca rosetta]